MLRFSPQLLPATILAMSGLLATNVCWSADDDRKAVEAALSDFHVALNRLFTGDVEPMIDVWSHAADVSYMGPDGGFQVGWDTVLAEWKQQAAKKLGGSIRPEEVHMIVGRTIAVTQNYETGENTNTAGGPQQVRIRATNIFRKENGRWKLIGHHTDSLPFLED
jgi:ketosteroid isomerase-like protein